MKRIILVSAFAVLAACGSTKSEVSVGTATDQTSASESAAPGTDASDGTINVDNFGDMPPQCIELFTSFLKQIEPETSKIEWETATRAEFEAFGDKFEAESDAFDTQTSAAGCDQYNLDPSDDKIFDQIVELAASEAPGTVGFLKFIDSLSDASTSGSLPTDCAGTIAAIEPFLASGKTMNDLTLAEVTRFGGLMNAVTTNCTAEQSAAFYGREDVTTFTGG
jgi:hypothetical protein